MADDRSGGSRGRALLAFLGLSIAVGVLATVAVTPALAIGGLAAASSISMFEKLPGYLEINDLAEKTNIYATVDNGAPYLLASFFDQDREEVEWENVSQYAKDAAVAGEDPRFYEHGGIDIQGTLRAALVSVSGGDIQGGSSITQQYVKNVRVQQAVATAKTPEEEDAAVESAIKQTPDRKLKEMRLAIGVEKKYTKDQILLGYLNIAFFGGRVYGIESAANYYFGTNAAELSLEESASLIAIVNNPEKFRLDKPDNAKNGAENGYASTKSRRDYILDKMLEYSKITQKEHDAAVAAPIAPVITEPSTGCTSAGGSAYFCDYVYWTIRNNEAFGATEAERMNLLKRGGLDVFTTIDLSLQGAAESAMSELVPRTAPGIDVGASSVSVEVGTGRVLEMTQNKMFSDDPEVLTNPEYSAVNYNTDGEYGGSAGFQPGSTYKIFTLGEWIKEGHSLNEYVNAYRRSDWGTFNDSCNGPVSDPSWSPRNDEGGSGGTWTALYNTQNSENTGFVAMAKELDLCGIRQTAEAFGVHRADGNPLQQGPASILGTNEIAPVTMAAAFAAVAANGVVCEPIVIDKVLRHGEEITVPSANCAQKVDPKITSAMAYAMQRVMSNGTGSTSDYRTEPHSPMIGKTGTTDNAEATWMSGASTRVATTVGVYNASGHVNLRDTYFNGTEAAVIRHEIWPRIMSTANAKYPGGEFPEPDGSSLVTVTRDVPDVRGKSIAEAEQIIEDAGFGFADGGSKDSELPAGQVVGTDPSGTAPRGSLITAFTSNGALVVVPQVDSDPQSAAKTLRNAGFTVKTSEQETTDPKAVGRVISIDPAPGTAVAPGSTIMIVVGKAAPKPAPTPEPTPSDG
ncbi:MAG: transglycosylase domain-containing protein [Leifsonia sp.]